MSEWFVNTISSLELVNVSKLFFIALQTLSNQFYIC